MRRSIEELEKELKVISNLPTLPSTAAQLLEMLGKTNVSMNDISNVMHNDPSITAKILQLANSAYYSLRKKVDTLRMALVVLGVNEIINIIIGISLLRVFPDEPVNGKKIQNYWEHSCITAHYTKLVAEYFGIRLHGEEFTAGLLHDIGKLIMNQYFHKEYIEIVQSLYDNPVQKNYIVEDNYLGATHMQLGAWLGAQWKIPFHIIECILHHHHPRFVVNKNQLVNIVHIADILANYVVDQENMRMTTNELQDSYAWKALSGERALDLAPLLHSAEQNVDKAKFFSSLTGTSNN